MDQKEKLNRDKKILQDFLSNLSEARLKLLEKNTEWASAIEERSLTFSQFLFSFLFSIGAALITLFFSVDNLNNLILSHSTFGWSVWIYFISLICFIFYFKERLDVDSARLVKSSEESDADFNASMAAFERQLNNGINMENFYAEIQKLSDDNNLRKIALEKESKSLADYYLELFMSLLLISFWLLFFSTKDWCLIHLFIGIVIIFILTNNQNKPFYKLVRYYSRLMSKIFPTKNI